MSKPIFVSERIASESGRFDVAAMARGEPGVPKAFVWRGQRFEVARTLNASKALGTDRGDAYVRRHYYEIETSDALHMNIYFERNPGSRSRTRAWWLYTLAYPEPFLETPRLFLRRWTLADRGAFRLMTQDPEAMRFQHDSIPLTDAQADAALQSTIDRYERLGYSDWAVVNRTTGDILGESGLDLIESTGEVEIGWMLLPKYWGKGFGYEAASVVKKHALTTLRLGHLIALVRPDNSRSIALATKLGLRETGRMLHSGHDMLKFEISAA